jgi:hypothetical protein
VGVLQQAARELPLRLECDLVWDTGQFAALIVGGPGLGQAQGTAGAA